MALIHLVIVVVSGHIKRVQLRKKTARAILLLHHKPPLFASLFILSYLGVHLCEDRFHDPCRRDLAIS